MTSGRQRLLPLALAGLTVVFFYVFMAHSFLVTRTVPGDIGDARFNLYILEHTFRWIGGHDPTYASPGLFYPYPGIMFFSDTFAGSAVFYVVFRGLGIAPYEAFTLWVFTGYLLTFVASYFSLLRLKFEPFTALAAAIIFTFSLPSLAQLGHAQLVYRFGIPLAFLGLWNYLRTGEIRHAVSVVMWVSLQILCSIYLGIFLMLILAIVAIWSVVLNRQLHPLPGILRGSVGGFQSDAKGSTDRRWPMLLFGAIAAIAATLLLFQHHRWSGLYGLGRRWEEIASMIPRPQSYFLMEPLSYWRAISKGLGTGIPMQHEHNLFMGLGALSLFLVGAASTIRGKARPDADNLSRVVLLAIVSLLCLVTMFGTVSFYFLLTYIPGFDSIRAVSRIGIVTMFLVAIVAATGARAILQSSPKILGPALLCILYVASLSEIFMLEKSRFSIVEAEGRTQTTVNEALRKSAGITSPVLFVMEGDEAPYKIHLDAMLAAQQLGWPTVNGYSGNEVPGSEYRPTCNVPARQLAAYANWRHLHHLGPVIDLNDLSKRIVYVGWPACDGSADIRSAFPRKK